MVLFKRNTKKTGDAAENIACHYLQKKGLKLLKQNYHSKNGELDLVMQDKDSLVFVEVRYRNHSNYGTAAESVDYRKQRKIIKTALYYLQQHPEWQNAAARFDVIGITSSATLPEIEWIQNAFNAE